MKTMRGYERWVRTLVVWAIGVVIAESAVAQGQPPVTITVDENGNGTADTTTLSLFTGFSSASTAQPAWLTT
jgi:hypothetical protein